MLIRKHIKTITRITLVLDQVSGKIRPNKNKQKLEAVHFPKQCRPVIPRIFLKVRKDPLNNLKEWARILKTRMEILTLAPAA